jgi:hypothetical protein
LAKSLTSNPAGTSRSSETATWPVTSRLRTWKRRRSPETARSPGSDQRNITVLYNTIDEHYFSTMQIPLVAGRPFSSSDTAASQPVAIVNETMARRYWPHGTPLGGADQNR